MKVVLATDGTQYGEAALKMAQKLALGSGDEVKVVCVIDMAVPLAVDLDGGYLPDTSELERAARERSETIADAAVARLRESWPAATLSREVLFGSPDSRIVETAEAFRAHLIILGSHGYNAWERLLLGSVSNSVVHHAPCSVLVVRALANE
jgi:nucleotide-binding universal stress UspA family protein